MANDVQQVGFSTELNDIADILIAHVPANWSSVEVKYEVDEGYFGVDIWGTNGEDTIFLDVGAKDTDRISKLFEEIRKKCIAPWKEANFTATAIGKCHIDFGY